MFRIINSIVILLFGKEETLKKMIFTSIMEVVRSSSEGS